MESKMIGGDTWASTKNTFYFTNVFEPFYTIRIEHTHYYIHLRA